MKANKRLIRAALRKLATRQTLARTMKTKVRLGLQMGKLARKLQAA